MIHVAHLIMIKEISSNHTNKLIGGFI